MTKEAIDQIYDRARHGDVFAQALMGQFHQPSSGVGYSTFKDQQIHLKEMESLKWDLYDVLAENSGKTKEEIEKLCDRDYWMKPQDAITNVFVDGIIKR